MRDLESVLAESFETYKQLLRKKDKNQLSDRAWYEEIDELVWQIMLAYDSRGAAASPIEEDTYSYTQEAAIPETGPLSLSEAIQASRFSPSLDPARDTSIERLVESAAASIPPPLPPSAFGAPADVSDMPLPFGGEPAEDDFDDL